MFFFIDDKIVVQMNIPYKALNELFISIYSHIKRKYPDI